VLVDVEPEAAEVARHRVGHGALLPGRTGKRRELCEQIEDVRGDCAILRGDRAHRGTRTSACQPCGDELTEERRGTRRARLELRVELTRDEPGMVGKLDDLHEPALLERP